jgi:outer membrane protein TolC
MSMRPCVLFVGIAASAAAFGPGAARLRAQSPDQPASVFERSVPAPQTSGPDVLPLTLTDAVRRGLTQNLGIVLEQSRVNEANATRLRQLSELLPHLSANVRQTDQKVNLAAFGFTGFPGIPEVIGPFGVFDARMAISAPIFDAAALGDWRASRSAHQAEVHTAAQARETVALIVATIYLDAITSRARVDAARTEVSTSEALARLAEDQKNAGVIAGIDLLRQQVQLQAARARLIEAQTTFDNRLLDLARAIGLPPTQRIDLVDAASDAAAADVSVSALMQQAAAREDLKAAEARLAAAQARRAAATGASLPSAHVDADIGALGSSVSNARETFAVSASVHVPVFDGGSARSRRQLADAEVRQRESELADLRAGVEFEIAAAANVVRAAEARVQVARNGESLARQQLEQARDRFQAGVSSTIELVQAEEAVAAAVEQTIGSVHSRALARAGLARATGQVEAQLGSLVGGSR